MVQAPPKGGGIFFALGLSSCIAIQYVVMRAPHVLPWLYVGQVSYAVERAKAGEMSKVFCRRGMEQIIPLLVYRGITYHMYVVWCT